MIKLSNFFAIGIFLVLKINAISQIYNFKIFDEDYGLPQNYIYEISQDSRGFIYLSTGNGFSAFGGNKFKNFSTKDSLYENFVNTHFIDSRGITWIGHFQTGISYLKNTTFYKLTNSDKIESKITSFVEDSHKNIWFIAQGKGVFFIDTNFTIHSAELSSDFYYNSITIDSEGRLICGTDNGLLLFDISKPVKPELICNQFEFQNKNISLVKQDVFDKKYFWVVINGEGVFGIKETSTCLKYFSSITKELNSKQINVLNIYSDSESNLWISLANEGLKKVEFKIKSNKNLFTVKTINKANGLPNLYIKSIFEDYEGNMWFGTFGSGLIQLNPEKFSFYKPIDNSNIFSVLIDKQGKFWLGTEQGLLKYNYDDESKSILYNKNNGLVTDKINCVIQDLDKTIWVGTENNGVFVLDNNSEKFYNFSLKHKLTSLSINSIIQEKKGKIIIATKDGVYFYDKKNSSISRITTIEGLLHNNVLNLFCDKKNRIWFSSRGAPPYFLEKDEFTVLKEISGLKNYFINSIYEDKKGFIWISTEGDGIFRYDGVNTKNYKVEQGLLSNFSYSIIGDKNNDVWVFHKNGISCIKNKFKDIKTYTKSDGLLFIENNLNSAIVGHDNNLWFGTTTGLVMYNTDLRKLKKVEPRTNILLLTLNKNTYTSGDEISLDYDNYSLRVDYIGISLTDPSKVTYKYRLLGIDSSWRYTKERFIEYPKIDDGNYIFEVYASNANDIWNTKPAIIKFTIGKPFWKKIWFWFFVIIIGIYSISYIIRSRTKKLTEAKKILEQKVEEKTHQLRHEKEQLEEIKKILEEKDKDITDSINYAHRIQDSILPDKEKIFKKLPHSFIFFRPRDIVSGDFYWYAETENTFIIAVVDCTGHGIPGAFMSLIGSTLLNAIVHNRKIIHPSNILDELNKGIVKTLKQESNINSSRDGMDASICSIKKDFSKMIFSSASRPLYFVRENELNEINLKNPSIGGSYKDHIKEFESIEIDLLKNDMFYLFSDGYGDQFDVNDTKKFGSRRLKKLFIEISSLTKNEQYNILEKSHDNWKGDNNQIDDITVLGFKI